ncbi:hypothetical protein PHJA_001395400 [Phtheirospermum japonicum]|uniref:Uncharacterized protein n=1 Tax=Phtheirospermum japonicum TaxID=374723 RepID=A0A830C2Y0_9LAMI|nr:hypothetical protein PHJA_001395400 [Phtheirospermum japonicum]
MSIEESKILKDLERDVENNLEEEIKEEIYHLALKLHRLYQHQKQRILNQSSSDHQNVQRNAMKKMLSEVNINIKLEGGTTIRINEIRKEARGNDHLTSVISARSKRAQIVKGKAAGPIPRPIKFDWSRTLRSEASNAMIVNPGPQTRSQDRATGLLKVEEGGYGNQECITRAGWKY